MKKSAQVRSEKTHYQVGETARRPWGRYAVMAVGMNAAGQQFCEKDIVITPGSILSLQSHKHRYENWTVTEGILTVVLNGCRVELRAGESIHIPPQGIHCMANMNGAPCRVYERQEGLCREDDIVRYVDVYGRKTSPGDADALHESIQRYREILSELGKAG